jgi:hypothetical protein
MRKQTAVWTTKSGERLRICDMTDQHLNNAIALLKRSFEKLLALNISAAYSIGSSFNPDGMASYYCDRDIDMLEAMSPDDFAEEACPLYPKLLAEQERRHRLYRESVKEE